MKRSIGPLSVWPFDSVSAMVTVLPKFLFGSEGTVDRRTSLLFLLLLLFGATQTYAQDGQTTEAEVITSMGSAMSGPSTGYYPTSVLKLGEKLTVVAQRSDGWVAVVPPKTSFSLIRAEDVQEDQDGNARVKKDFAEVRVGSTLSDAHYVTQLNVDAGEKLQIVDETSLDENGKKTQWYKVVPPKSEVRYIRREYLRIKGGNPSPGNDYPIVASAPMPPAAQTSPASQTRLIARTGSIGNTVIPPAKPMAQKTGKISVSSRPYSDEEPPIEFTDLKNASLDDRIRNVRGQLEVMRTRTPSAWDLEGAKRVVSNIRAAAQTAPQQEGAQELLNEVRRLDDVREKYTRQIRTRDRAIERDNELARLQVAKQQTLDTVAVRYAAQGILRRTSADIDTRVGFVLEDDGGITTHYIMALPGLNLERYVGQRVGLDGQISMKPGSAVPTITVEQLTPLVGCPSRNRR